MSTTTFENLEVYKVSEELADRVWESVLTWNRLAQDTVGKQMIKSADSVGANIAEGVGRYSIADNRRFTRIARGSLYETRHWLRRACRRKLLGREEIAILSKIVDKLSKLLGGYLRSLSSRIHEK